MRMLAPQSIRSSIVVVAVAVGFSSFTLWLVESWIKYLLFLVEILAIVALYLVICNFDAELFIKHTRFASMHSGLLMDMFLISSALGILIINVERVQGGLIQAGLALIVTSLLVGYALLNIFGLARYFSRLETAVMSYVLSYAFTGVVSIASFSIEADVRTTFTLSIIIAIGLASMLKHKRSERPSVSRPSSFGFPLFVLVLSMAFLTLAFCFMYPGFSLLPGTDTSRHYASSIIISRKPEGYIGSTYLFAHLHESMFLSLSSPSLQSAQMALVTLNLMLPVAFYVMTRAYLRKIDTRLPPLSTLFWVFFTNSFGGFAWTYFASLKLTTTGQTQLQLLATSADKTFNGTIYGILGLWYVPATVSMVVLMAMVFLMSKKEVARSNYLALFSILTAVLYLTHVTEAVIFALFLAVYGVALKDENLRIDDSIKASIVGFLFVTVVYYILSSLTVRFTLNLSQMVSIVGPLLLLLLSVMARARGRILKHGILSFQRKLGMSRQSFLKVLTLSLLLVYAVAFLSWVLLMESFHTWQVDTIGLIPWFIYPVMLGINGLLAIVSLNYITRNTESHRPLMLFIAFMFFTFIVGKLVSVINLYFFDAGYWEKRFIWLMKLSLAILAPIPVVFLIDKLRSRNIHVDIKTAASVTIIGTIVLYGVSTTFLNVEYWSIISNNPANQLSSDEMNAVNVLKETFDSEPKAWLATVTDTSAGMATFAAPTDMLGLRQLLYTANRPEMAFTQLYRHPTYAHPLIYLHNRDVEYLSDFSDGFLAHYLVMLPLIFDGSEARIYNVSKPSFPRPNSDNILLVPFDEAKDKQTPYIASEMLSQGFYNYTIAYDQDDKALNASTVMLSLDPPEGNIITGTFRDEFSGTLESWDISKGIWEIKDDELLGGEGEKIGEGILLSPAFAENFTATFNVELSDGNPTTLNYVSLVYSWIDSENYRIADVLFAPDNYVYVLFRTFAGGVEETFPNWPGTKTDLTWSFGDQYNITVTVNGTSNEIAINSKTRLSLGIGNTAGHVGLRYYRFNAISFDDFQVAYATEVNLRPTEDYLNYLRSRGTIVLINSDGYGFFGDTLFSISNSTVNAQEIRGKSRKTELPIEISVPVIVPKNNTTVLSHYVTTRSEIPFVLQQRYDGGNIFYVNAYPIIQAMRKCDNPSVFYDLLGHLLDDLNLTKLDPDTILSFDGYVEEIRLSGEVTIETDSLLFPPKLQCERVDVEVANGSYTFHNVTSISVSKFSRAIVEIDRATIGDGHGFYANVQINSDFSVDSVADSFNLKIATDDGSFTLTNVSLISIAPSREVLLLTRTPTVSSSEVTFVEFYPQGSLQWRTRTYGQNLTVTGPTQFTIAISDSYSALQNVEISSSFHRDPPIVTYDFFSTLPTAAFWALLLLPIFVSVGIFTSRESHQDKQRTGTRI
jgi:hypothetical protein